MRKRTFPTPGQFLIPRGQRCFAMQVVYYSNQNTAICHRWDIDEKKRPTKQTTFGDPSFVQQLDPLPLGAIGHLWRYREFSEYFQGDAYDIFGQAQLELF